MEEKLIRLSEEENVSALTQTLAGIKNEKVKKDSLTNISLKLISAGFCSMLILVVVVSLPFA